ncbi:heparinase II/III family protein [Colwellia sp. 1_MG-2023]|uniref:heparinase II/III domain-containing protein n=1 Tax=Colwellia sp. 1_MG-2023 TaxID=3062649 RepID=UPI0026E438B3|nr:heparinase II/III family protein [Colwellia sp. 1_MG-2023]MDO6444472.1 heparinase II/III family protein [Colwellia sp. 1_MG-2023]
MLLAVSWCVLFSANSAASHSPNLVISHSDVPAMKKALSVEGSFTDAFNKVKDKVDTQLAQAINIPVPKDSGGGFTHERHKKNYRLMYDAGIVFQLTQNERYAQYVRDMLLEYAELYPTLPLHPKRKKGKTNPGKLFWQSLNEAVWLVYTSQAYDMILSSLSEADKNKIETGLFRPIVKFLSVDSPKTFNKVHNHGTWLTAAVGMTGYVLGELEWVEQALYGLDKSGKGGFLRQLDELFSPEGYYNEGPYYQRYALMPFVTFAKAIENNQPERKIFAYRDGIILKAIDTTIQLSYNKLFFPINDAIKSKGIDTIELVHGVAIAYGFTQDTDFLDIAKQQDQVILTGDGLKVAQALDDGLATPYQFKSKAFGDGADGKQGALVIMRQKSRGQQALLFKPAAQGLGHGHFDKLTWQFYDNGHEIVSDYGAARFLNVEAKSGGGYLPENNTFAKQTVAHNTVVVDENSHFNGKVKTGNKHHPELLFFAKSKQGSISSAQIDTAYQGVSLKRTMALVKLPEINKPLAIDIFDVNSDKKSHQFDLPLHYQGQLIDTNFVLNTATQSLSALGHKNGYQHLWLTATSQPEKGLAKVTWLNENGKFYTQTAIVDGDTEALFTRIGANDPSFNLRNESGFIYRKKAAKQHRFISVLEPHGQYNPAKEFTVAAQSTITKLTHHIKGDIELVEVGLTTGQSYLLAFNRSLAKKTNNTFTYQDNNFSFNGQFKLFKLSNK